jgi:hypothetical protein
MQEGGSYLGSCPKVNRERPARLNSEAQSNRVEGKRKKTIPCEKD